MKNDNTLKTHHAYFIAVFIFGILTLWTEIASTTLTLYFFRGLGDDSMTRFGTIGFAIANDLVKVFAITLGIIAIRAKDKMHMSIFFIAGVIALLVSFFASQNYDLNKSAKIQNETILNSSEYKRQEELYSTTKDSLKNSQEQLKKMKTIEIYVNNNPDIINLKQQIKSLGTLENYQKSNNNYFGSKTYRTKANSINKELEKQYTNKKNNLTEKLAAKENTLRKEFLTNKKEAEESIKKYSENLDNINNRFEKIDGNSIEVTEGMNNFSKAYGISVKWIATWKNAWLEFLGVVLFILTAFCWRMYKFNKNGGELEEIDLIKSLKDKVQNKLGPETETATSQNKLEMKNNNAISTGINNLKTGISNLINKKHHKKIDLTKKPNKIGFTPPKKTDYSKDRIKPQQEIEVDKKEKIEKSLPNEEISKPIKQNLNAITRNNIIKYLKFLYDKKYWWQGNPTGYKKIQQLSKLDNTIAPKIRSTLETLEIIETEEKIIGKRKMNVTKLKYEIQEAIKKIFEN